MIGIVGTRAPIEFYSYAMRKGDYAAGTVIGGIAWDSHFTDLRVAVTNKSASDYQDLDLAVQPDQWSHKAAILNNPGGCDLLSIGGNTVLTSRTKGGATRMTVHRLGESFDAQDNVGDVFMPLATESGYRLRCGRFPAHFTLRIVFAIVAVHPSIMSTNHKPGTWGTEFTEIAGTKSDFDILDPRPSPSIVTMKGRYVKNVTPFSITNTITVTDGN